MIICIKKFSWLNKIRVHLIFAFICTSESGFFFVYLEGFCFFMVSMKLKIRKKNVIWRGFKKDLLEVDLHFQRKGLLKYLELFLCLPEICMAQVCP